MYFLAKGFGRRAQCLPQINKVNVRTESSWIFGAQANFESVEAS